MSKRALVWLGLVAMLAAACGGGSSDGGGDGGDGGGGGGSAASPFTPEPPAPPVRIPTQPGNYNYSPAVMDEGNVVKAWWCSATPQQASDQIWFQEYDKATKKWSKLQPVLDPGNTPGDWDVFGVCHPSVIKGAWPGGPNGQSWSYAMYYTSTDVGLGGGSNNSTGVVFSMDGIKWSDQHASYNPMIKERVPRVRGTYGAGLPSAWSRGGSAVTLFWTDTTAEKRPDGYASRVLVATSEDGIKFSAPKLVSQDGGPTYWKNDFAFDDSVQPPVVYSAQALTFRQGVAPEKNETYNFGIYRLPMDQLLAGTGKWEKLGEIDTNLTGLPLNLEPGIVRSPEGKVVGTPVTDGLEIWFGGGGQVPTSWQLHSVTFRTTPERRALKRYSAGGSWWVTTGFVLPAYRGGGAESPVDLGFLDVRQGPGQVALDGCQRSHLDVDATGVLTDAKAERFVSVDGCPGTNPLGVNGFLFSQPPAGVETKALYGCKGAGGQFVSTDPRCEGQAVEKLLGHSRAKA